MCESYINIKKEIVDKVHSTFNKQALEKAKELVSSNTKPQEEIE